MQQASAKKALTIRFLEQARAGEAAGLLSRVFKESVDTVRPDIAEAFSANVYRPVFLEAIAPDGRLVGLVACNRSPRGEQERFYAVTKLAVEFGVRGRGVGRALMKRAEDFIGQNWLHGKPGKIILADGTKIGNPDSRYYEHMGYKPTCPSQSFEGGPILEKRLN